MVEVTQDFTDFYQRHIKQNKVVRVLALVLLVEPQLLQQLFLLVAVLVADTGVLATEELDFMVVAVVAVAQIADQHLLALVETVRQIQAVAAVAAAETA
jgi:hypothetical protein